MKLIARQHGDTIPVEVERDGTGYRVRLRDGEWMQVDFVTASRFLRSLRMPDGRQFVLVPHHDGSNWEISFSDRTLHVDLQDPLSLKRKRRDDESSQDGRVTAPMPGRVVRIVAGSGDTVQRGSPLLVLEAMKMQNEIVSPRDGVVAEVFVEAGQTVEGGALLVSIG